MPTKAKKTVASKNKGSCGISATVHSRRDAFGATRSVTALCDCDLLGRVFKSGECVLDLRKYEGFYKGEAVTEEKAAALAARADNLNIMGEKSLAAARRAVEIRNVKRVAGVPHAQVYRI